jgi:hypothetical protein
LPTRLLHFKNGHLRLCSGQDLDIGTRYATLSHRWGDLPILSLTKEKIKSFHTAIPVTELCQTFQDALQVLVELGLEFLWIDSLCILHDDDEDWKRESVLMSSVYGCSDITIAAASSSDGSQGCFYKRQMPFPRLLQVHTRHSMTWDLVPHCHSGWEPSIHTLPLSRRGWAYQKMKLSTRTIFSTDCQLIWRCSTWTRKKNVMWKTSVIQAKFMGARKFAPGESKFWEATIREYSGRDRAVPSDKLVAIIWNCKKKTKSSSGRLCCGNVEGQFGTSALLGSNMCWHKVQACFISSAFVVMGFYSKQTLSSRYV